MTRYRDYGTEREAVDEPTGEFQSYPGHPEGRAVGMAIVLTGVMVAICVGAVLLGVVLI